MIDSESTRKKLYEGGHSVSVRLRLRRRLEVRPDKRYPQRFPNYLFCRSQQIYYGNYYLPEEWYHMCKTDKIWEPTWSPG